MNDKTTYYWNILNKSSSSFIFPAESSRTSPIHTAPLAISYHQF